MQPIPMKAGDTLLMKKNHPCGSNRFRLLRVGSDVRMVCVGCGRDLTLPRIQLEARVRAVIPGEPSENEV